MASFNEATPIVSSNSRPPTLTRLLATCAPSSWFLPPPHHDGACHSTVTRVQADAGTTAYDCVARLGGLKWATPASPGVRVLSSFFDILEQHPSLLDLFREELDAISNAPRRAMPRKSEDNVKSSFTGLFYAGLQSATAALLDHYAAITEPVGTSSAPASTPATKPRYSVWLDQPEIALRTQGDAVIYIQQETSNDISSISIGYQPDNVHHSLAKVCQEGALSHIPILDHEDPVLLQDLEEEKSRGADAVATKAIIQCVSSESRFLLLMSVPFFQIGELVQHPSTQAATARDPVASTSASSTSMSAATAYSPAPFPKAKYSLILQELARWVEPSPTTLNPEAAETLGTDLPRRSFIVSFIALAFTAVIEVPNPDPTVVDALLDARSQAPNRPRTRSKPDSDSDSDRDDDPSPRVQKAQKTSAEATCAQAKDSIRPITPPASAELQSDLSFDPLKPVTRVFSSPPASTDWSPTTLPLSGSRLPSDSITIVQDRGFMIKASLSNAHWSMMGCHSYTGTSRVELVEIGFDIISSVPSDSPLPSRLSSNPSPASDFIRGLHLSDAVLRWLSEDPREELEDDRIPLELLDRFEPTADRAGKGVLVDLDGMVDLGSASASSELAESAGVLAFLAKAGHPDEGGRWAIAPHSVWQLLEGLANVNQFTVCQRPGGPGASMRMSPKACLLWTKFNHGTSQIAIRSKSSHYDNLANATFELMYPPFWADLPSLFEIMSRYCCLRGPPGRISSVRLREQDLGMRRQWGPGGNCSLDRLSAELKRLRARL